MNKKNGTKPKCAEKPKHKVYFNEEVEEWVCEDHEKDFLGMGHNSYTSTGNSIVRTLNYHFYLNTIQYSKVAKPLDKRKKIGNEELKRTFRKLEGKILKVSILKELFRNKIKINDQDTSTTVISSAIMRRLGKLTGLKWHQERLKGEDGEILVRFIEGPYEYVSPKKLKQERLKQYLVKDQIESKVDELYAEKENVEEGFYVDDEGDVLPDYYEEGEREDMIDYYKERIKKLEKLLGIKGGDDVSSKESD